MLMPPQPQNPYGIPSPMDAQQPPNPLMMGGQPPMPPQNPLLPGDSPSMNPLVPTQAVVPHGTDDWSSINGAESGDFVQYEDLDAIDKANIHGLNDTKLKELGVKVRDLIKEGVTDRYNGGRDMQIDVWRDLYEMTPPTKQGPWKKSSKVVATDLTTAVDTVSARRVESLVGSKERLSIDSELPEEMDAITWLKDFTDKELHRGLEFDKFLARVDRTSTVDAGTIIHTYWKREYKKVRRRVVIDDNFLIQHGITPMSSMLSPMAPNPMVKVGKNKYPFGSRQVVEKNIVYNNCFGFEMIDMKNFFMWPATSTSEENAVLVGHFFAQTADELRTLAKDGYYDEDAVIRALKTPSSIDVLTSERIANESWREKTQAMVSNSHESYNNEFGRRHMANVYAKIYDGDDDGIFEDIHFVVDWNSGEVLRCRLNPHDNGKRPYKYYNTDPRVGTGFYSYSLPQRLKSLEDELNAVARQGIDRGSLAATIFMAIDRGAKDPNAMEVNIGGINIWDTATQGTIRNVYPLPDLPSGNLSNRSDLSHQIQRASGADEAIQGVQSNNGTLGQTNIAVAAGNIRLNRSIIECLSTITWVYNQFFDYLQQYVEEEQDFHYIRDGKDPYNVVQLLDNLGVTTHNIVTATSDQVNPEAQVKAMLAEKAFTVATNSPAVKGNIVKTMRCVKTYLTEIGYKEDLSYRIGTEQDWEQMQQMQSMMPPPPPDGQPPAKPSTTPRGKKPTSV